jgi:hypothetical protein
LPLSKDLKAYVSILSEMNKKFIALTCKVNVIKLFSSSKTKINKLEYLLLTSFSRLVLLIGLYHPLDGVTNLKYKLLCFLTPDKKNSKRKALAFNWDGWCHLALS